MSLQPVELRFLGQKVNLKTEGDADLVREVMDLAQERLNSAEDKAKNASPNQVAILALLDVCEAYVMARRKVVDQKRTLSVKSAELNELIKSETSH